MGKGPLPTVLLGLVLVGVGLIAGLLIARSPEVPRAKGPVPDRPAATEALEGRVAELEDWMAETRHEVAALRREGERLDPFLDAMEAARPRLEAARANANRLATVVTLRNVLSAEAQLQMSAKIDLDNDGVGEYGGFFEMSGAGKGRMSSVLVPAVLSEIFGRLNERGEATRNDYLYRIYLPGRGGAGIGEPAGGFAEDSGVSPARAETAWCAYAWPKAGGESPGPTFFVNQEGEVLVAPDARYGGSGEGPAPDAAFREAGGLESDTASGVKGQDGNTWEAAG